MFIPFPRMQADDRKETLENRNTWFQIKYLHEIFSFPAALCELSTLPEEQASWQERRLGTNKPLPRPIEDLTHYQLAGSRRGPGAQFLGGHYWFEQDVNQTWTQGWCELMWVCVI